MNFKQWLTENHPYNKFQSQQFFPFAQPEPEVDAKKVLRYKSPETYAKAQSKGGRDTEKSYITHVWIHPEYRTINNQPNDPDRKTPWENLRLYRSLREFAAQRGITSLEPNDELTSKSYRSADAEYQYRLAQQNKKPQS